MTKVLYSSDIHGNHVQYNKMIDYAIKTSTDVLIIGGDIAPKGFRSEDFIGGQRNFFVKSFPEMFAALKHQLPRCKVYLMMGNDDCAVNLDVLGNNDPDLYHVIHERRLSLTDDFDIVGYSPVPITPFGIKDWEKFDLSNIPDELAARYAKRKKTNYRLHGVKSTSGRWEEFRFDPGVEANDSIQKDLENTLFTENPRRTVYVIHTPPDNTNLDQIGRGEHVGSIAVRLFIEKYRRT